MCGAIPSFPRYVFMARARKRKKEGDKEGNKGKKKPLLS
jgi:hypothetical protein